MPRLDNPIVLVTRPKHSSDRFVADLKSVAGRFRPIVSPAFENIGVVAETPDFKVAIFTSRTGVDFAPDGKNRIAYCVGDSTSDVARKAGYQAVSAQGNAADLVHLILDNKPTQPLLHIRGEISQGDVSATLRRAGLKCDEVVVYRKSATALTVQALTALTHDAEIILTVFSAETVSILADTGCDFSNVFVVAISPTVARATSVLSPAKTYVADAPNLGSIVAATARLIA